MRLVDAHCHADEYTTSVLKDFIDKLNLTIVGVGINYASSLKIVEHARVLSHFIPCIGIHPWEVGKIQENEVEKIIDLLFKNKIKCLGEIGLDMRFARDTIGKQREIFKTFLEVARENDLILNIHSVDTWREIFELLIKYEIRGAVFHWYSGPQDLLERLSEEGYFITINPAVKFQKKHRGILKAAPLEILLTESDGPYNYRGYNLSPPLIPELLAEIARVKEIEKKDAVKIVYSNFKRLFS